MVQPHDYASLDRVIQMLVEKQPYDHVAELLLQAYNQATDNAAYEQASYLLAAHQLCLLCQQHKQASEQAQSLEKELQDQLQVLLTSISAESKTAVSLTSLLDSVKPVSPQPPVSKLWKKVQNFISLRTKPEVVEPETAVSPPQTSDKLTHDKQPIVEINIEKLETPPVLPDPPKSTTVIYFLGAFRVYQNEQQILNWNGLKGVSIFKYLIAQIGTPITKDKLMDMFWPDIEPDASRRNLHQAIYSLRKTLNNKNSPLQPILFENDCYLLNSELTIWLDYKEFDQHVNNGRQLEKRGSLEAAISEFGVAEGLYQGSFLPEDIYEEWTNYHREQLRQDYVDITDRLCKHYLLQKEYTATIAICQKQLAQDNCHETAHRRLMRCFYAQNQRHLAIRQYHRCIETLHTELQVPPSEKTKTFYHAIVNR